MRLTGTCGMGRVGLTAALGLWGIALVGCQKPPDQTSAQPVTSSSQPTLAGQKPILIAADSIGPIALDSSIRALRRQFPNARDQTFMVEENTAKGLEFPFPGLAVTATPSYSDSLPAESWVVNGHGGILPQGVSMDATWGELRRHYGTPEVYGGEMGLYAHFPRLPVLALGINYAAIPYHTVQALYDAPSADSIPDSARVIDRILIVRSSRSLPDSEQR